MLANGIPLWISAFFQLLLCAPTAYTYMSPLQIIISHDEKLFGTSLKQIIIIVSKDQHFLKSRIREFLLLMSDFVTESGPTVFLTILADFFLK